MAEVAKDINGNNLTGLTTGSQLDPNRITKDDIAAQTAKNQAAIAASQAADMAKVNAIYQDSMNEYRNTTKGAYNVAQQGIDAAVDVMKPYTQAGYNALSQLQGLLGTDGSDPSQRLINLENTPGYKFALDQGLKANQAAFAATGLGSSTAAIYGASQYAEGLAQKTYQQQVDNLTGLITMTPGAAKQQADYLYNGGMGLGGLMMQGAQGQLGMAGQYMGNQTDLLKTGLNAQGQALNAGTGLMNQALQNQGQLDVQRYNAQSQLLLDQQQGGLAQGYGADIGAGSGGAGTSNNRSTPTHYNRPVNNSSII